MRQNHDQRIQAPNGATNVLLHSCCAPCSGSVIEDIHRTGIRLTVYFYNPNIHPRKEYDLRKEENIRFADKAGIPFIDADYDTTNWFNKMSGHANDPERGARCSMCFDMRFTRTAQYAHENGFRVFTSCLGISRWKDFDQVTRAGQNAAAQYPGLEYWAYNWRKKSGSERMIEISKKERFYQQEYCGCVYSLRDTNKSRAQRGRKPIELGVKYYGSEPSDSKP